MIDNGNVFEVLMDGGTGGNSNRKRPRSAVHGRKQKGTRMALVRCGQPGQGETRSGRRTGRPATSAPSLPGHPGPTGSAAMCWRGCTHHDRRALPGSKALTGMG